MWRPEPPCRAVGYEPGQALTAARPRLTKPDDEGDVLAARLVRLGVLDERGDDEQCQHGRQEEERWARLAFGPASGSRSTNR
jgi:hypothetical protein